MKNIIKTLAIVGLVAASTTSCKKYLDVNKNPNQLTSATPDIVLPQALAGTASMSNTFNATYGATIAGYMANGGGVSGFGDVITFNYSSGYANGLWSGTYDNLQDYQYVLDQTQSTGNSKNLNAIARTMKAFAYLRLVDAYGDVPYSQALKGTSNLLPAYDKAEDIYKACITELNTAIATFKVPNTVVNGTVTTVNTASGPLGSIDITRYSPVTGTGGPGSPLSGTGLDMTNWIKFANTIKLRALIRIQKVASLASFFATEKSALENNFTNADLLINPGYVQQSGKQNPLFNSWAYSYTGQNSQNSYIPASFITGFYNGTKLTDDGRGRIIYRSYTIQSQLGSNASGIPTNPTGGQWYTGSTTAPASERFGLGVMKGYDQGQPILIAAESYLLQAEAALIGLIPGTPATLFDQGVTASFAYLDKDHLMNISSTRNPATEVTAYKAANATSYLVNYNLATSDDQRLEAIITQKYIALNMVNCDEGWNEYRRTQYPKSNPAGTAFTYMGSAPVANLSPRADKLAGRVLYPSSEYNFNSANVPTINTFTSLVFWDSRPR